MHVTKHLFFFLLIGMSFQLNAQVTDDSTSVVPLYKRVAIAKPNADQISTLDEIGVDLSCGAIHRNDSLILELSEPTLLQLEENEISYTVLVGDLSKLYESRAQELPKAREELEEMKETSRKKKDETVLKNVGQHDDCEEVDWTVPNNFNLNPNNSPNSFGGCLTYTQVLQELDDMRAQYPSLISLKLDASPTNQTTIEGRTIYYVRISDNPDIDEANEPETLYQSLVHSREPSSLMQMLFYMWYVLENYDTDQDIKNLVNNQALYFIPVFNPDGFVYNEVESPDGGGMQRKNRNTSGGCTTFLDGIDLNRNSAYYWGNGGASSNSCSNTYLGSGPFSENETQIMRDFFLLHDFKLSLNHHSYKNAMLHAYAGTVITNPRPDEYSKYNHDMTYYNRYAYGPSTSISSLNSGNMNDWMLGGPAGTSSNGTPTGTGSGKNTLAWTPENGTSAEGGFWPNPSNYVIIAKRAMRFNFLAAYYSGKFAKLHDLNQSDLSSLTGDLNFEIENLGQTPSDFTITVTPITANIISTGAPITITGMSVLEQEETLIDYTLNASIQAGDTVQFLVTLSNDYASDNTLYTSIITKIYQPNVLFSDDPDSDGLMNWTAIGGTWSITSDSYSGTSAITSTLNPPYSSDVSKFIQMNGSLDFTTAEKVLIQYYAKWDLERSFDYVQLEASTNGSTWTPLCGKLTKPGAPDENNTYSNKSGANNDFQPDGDQLYDGDTQDKWNMEEIIIDDATHSFLISASTVYLRFRFETDGTNAQDSYYNADFEGFTFDDFKCINLDANTIGISETDATTVGAFPNPISDKLSIKLNSLTGTQNVSIVDLYGNVVYANTNVTTTELHIDTQNWSSGVYFVNVNGFTMEKAVKL